jgi:hypothetical protein
MRITNLFEFTNLFWMMVLKPCHPERNEMKAKDLLSEMKLSCLEQNLMLR